MADNVIHINFGGKQGAAAANAPDTGTGAAASTAPASPAEVSPDAFIDSVAEGLAHPDNQFSVVPSNGPYGVRARFIATTPLQPLANPKMFAAMDIHARFSPTNEVESLVTAYLHAPWGGEREISLLVSAIEDITHQLTIGTTDSLLYDRAVAYANLADTMERAGTASVEIDGEDAKMTPAMLFSRAAIDMEKVENSNEMGVKKQRKARALSVLANVRSALAYLHEVSDFINGPKRIADLDVVARLAKAQKLLEGIHHPLQPVLRAELTLYISYIIALLEIAKNPERVDFYCLPYIVKNNLLDEDSRLPSEMGRIGVKLAVDLMVAIDPTKFDDVSPTHLQILHQLQEMIDRPLHDLYGPYLRDVGGQETVVDILASYYRVLAHLYREEGDNVRTIAHLGNAVEFGRDALRLADDYIEMVELTENLEDKLDVLKRAERALKELSDLIGSTLEYTPEMVSARIMLLKRYITITQMQIDTLRQLDEEFSRSPDVTEMLQLEAQKSEAGLKIAEFAQYLIPKERLATGKFTETDIRVLRLSFAKAIKSAEEFMSRSSVQLARHATEVALWILVYLSRGMIDYEAELTRLREFAVRIGYEELLFNMRRRLFEQEIKNQLRGGERSSVLMRRAGDLKALLEKVRGEGAEYIYGVDNTVQRAAVFSSLLPRLSVNPSEDVGHRYDGSELAALIGGDINPASLDADVVADVLARIEILRATGTDFTWDRIFELVVLMNPRAFEVEVAETYTYTFLRTLDRANGRRERMNSFDVMKRMIQAKRRFYERSRGVEARGRAR